MYSQHLGARRPRNMLPQAIYPTPILQTRQHQQPNTCVFISFALSVQALQPRKRDRRRLRSSLQAPANQPRSRKRWGHFHFVGGLQDEVKDVKACIKLDSFVYIYVYTHRALSLSLCLCLACLCVCVCLFAHFCSVCLSVCLSFSFVAVLRTNLDIGN